MGIGDMQKGDRVRLKDGTEATITAIGFGNFVISNPPVSVRIEDKSEQLIVLMNELTKLDAAS
jgi:hypothetical protein